MDSLVIRLASVAVLSVLASGAAAEQDYPTRPVRIIVPFPPGGSTDPMARFVAAKLSERWSGATIVVDNRPGGNTIIGNSIVARATPDGYTMGYCGGSLFSTPHLIANMPYDVLKDFVGVSGVVKSRVVLVVHPAVPVNSLKELIALVKAKPGQLNYGSSGIGTNTHLSAEWFKHATGTDILHVPYKGSGPLTNDLPGGRVNLSFQVSITQIPNIKAGKVRALAVSGDERLKALPDIPTFTEAGLPNYGLIGWTCLIAPAGTPASIRNKIGNTVADVLKSPDTAEYLSKQGLEPFVASPDETTALIKADVERYGSIIRNANIKYTH